MVLATGIRILATVDYVNNPYNAYIVAVSVVLSMVPVVSDRFFSKLPAEPEPLLHSGILLAAVSAVLLNLYFNGPKGAAGSEEEELTGRPMAH
jgi:NCS2 family nucleobase:cation symporter-2